MTNSVQQMVHKDLVVGKVFQALAEKVVLEVLKIFSIFSQTLAAVEVEHKQGKKAKI